MSTVLCICMREIYKWSKGREWVTMGCPASNGTSITQSDTWGSGNIIERVGQRGESFSRAWKPRLPVTWQLFPDRKGYYYHKLSTVCLPTQDLQRPHQPVCQDKGIQKASPTGEELQAHWCFSVEILSWGRQNSALVHITNHGLFALCVPIPILIAPQTRLSSNNDQHKADDSEPHICLQKSALCIS